MRSLQSPAHQRREVGAQLLDPFLEEREGVEDAGPRGLVPALGLEAGRGRSWISASRVSESPGLSSSRY